MLHAAGSHYRKRRSLPLIWLNKSILDGSLINIQSAQGSGSKRANVARDSESAGPAPPIRRTEVSSGVLGQNGYGPFRHVSSANWFMA
jgi:hypothetical protein